VYEDEIEFVEKKVTHTAKKKLFSRSVSLARALSPPICVPSNLHAQKKRCADESSSRL